MEAEATERADGAREPTRFTVFDRSFEGHWPAATRCWFLLGMLCAVVACLGTFVSGHRRVGEVCCPLALGVLLAPPAVRVGFRAFVQWRRALTSFVADSTVGVWFDEEIAALRGTTWMLYFAFAFAAMALLAFDVARAFAQLPPQWLAFCYAMVFLAGVVGALAACSLLTVARTVFRAGRFPVVVVPHSRGVTATGRMLCVCYGTGAVVWAAFAGSGLCSSLAGDSTLLVFALPVFLLFVGSFLWCQVPLHERMVEWKADLARSTHEAFESASERLLEAPSEERSLVVDHLRKRIEEIARLPEWPLAWQSFVGVAAAALVAISPAIAEKLLDVVG